MTNETMAGSSAEQVADYSAQPAQAGLSDARRMLIEQRITNERPSTGAAYILCIFVGVLGAHRFYLGRKGSGIAMLLISLTFFGLIITGLWAFIDLFLIPGMIRENVEEMRHRMSVDALI